MPKGIEIFLVFRQYNHLISKLNPTFLSILPAHNWAINSFWGRILIFLRFHYMFQYREISLIKMQPNLK